MQLVNLLSLTLLLIFSTWTSTSWYSIIFNLPLKTYFSSLLFPHRDCLKHHRLPQVYKTDWSSFLQIFKKNLKNMHAMLNLKHSHLSKKMMKMLDIMLYRLKLLSNEASKMNTRPPLTLNVMKFSLVLSQKSSLRHSFVHLIDPSSCYSHFFSKPVGMIYL